MAKARSFQKLEAWYRSRHGAPASEMSPIAVRPQRRVGARKSSPFALESLEARILLSGDLATAMPVVPLAQTADAPAVISLVTQPQLAAATLSSNTASPHFSYLNIADFGRSYGETTWGSPSSPSRTEAAVQWYAHHVDLTEQQEVLTHFRQYNPHIQSWKYALDLYQFQHEVSNLPESSFLHVSESTSVTLRDLNGNIMANYTIPAGGRFEIAVWNAKHFPFNLKDPGLRAYNSERILNLIGGEAGVFLDAHSTGFANTFQIGNQTRINSGGGIQEYGGLRAGDPALDAAYERDVINWLNQLHGRLTAAGKWGVVNQATNLAYEQAARDQAVAIGGFNTENLIAPDTLRGAESVWAMYDLTQRVTGNGGTAIITGKWNFLPANYTPGSYGSADARQDIWRLTFYYMVKESAGSSGKTYFDLTLQSYYSNNVPADQNQWYDAYQFNVGQPTGGMSAMQTGTSPADGAPYTVFSRPYSHALILFRTMDQWSSTDYGDRSAVTVPLNGNYQQLRENGTLGPVTDSIHIRNGEGLILLPVTGVNVVQSIQPSELPPPTVTEAPTPPPADPLPVSAPPAPLPSVTSPSPLGADTKSVADMLAAAFSSNTGQPIVTTTFTAPLISQAVNAPEPEVVVDPPPQPVPPVAAPAERSYTVAEMMALDWRTGV
jgi:hypothetical protein